MLQTIIKENKKIRRYLFSKLSFRSQHWPYGDKITVSSIRCISGQTSVEMPEATLLSHSYFLLFVGMWEFVVCVITCFVSFAPGEFSRARQFRETRATSSFLTIVAAFYSCPYNGGSWLYDLKRGINWKSAYIFRAILL